MYASWQTSGWRACLALTGPMSPPARTVSAVPAIMYACHASMCPTRAAPETSAGPGGDCIGPISRDMNKASSFPPVLKDTETSAHHSLCCVLRFLQEVEIYSVRC